MAPQVEFMQLSSYREGMVSSGSVMITKDIEGDVRGRDVLIIDDILESGRTLAFAKDLLVARGAKRVMTAVLIEKPGRKPGQLMGRSPYLQPVHLDGRTELIGAIVHTRISGVGTNSLSGHYVRAA